MVKKDNLIDYLFKISPDFQKFISKELDYLREEKLYYVVLGCYAHYIFEKYKKNDLYEIKEVFNKVEFLLINGDDEVKKIITLGFFESLQNILLTENIDLNIFDEFLSIKSKEAWDSIKYFWDNKR